jgi:hypothetical protein
VLGEPCLRGGGEVDLVPAQVRQLAGPEAARGAHGGRQRYANGPQRSNAVARGYGWKEMVRRFEFPILATAVEKVEYSV